MYISLLSLSVIVSIITIGLIVLVIGNDISELLFLVGLLFIVVIKTTVATVLYYFYHLSWTRKY